MHTRNIAFAGLLAMAIILGGAAFAMSEVLPEEETEDELNDEEIVDLADEENVTGEKEGPRPPMRRQHPGLRFIFDLDENASDEINITQLKEDLGTLLEELKEDGYFNHTKDCNRTFEPRDNRTPPEEKEGSNAPHAHGRRMRMHRRHFEECQEIPSEA